jgi:preprotein translocase subunit SecY
MTMPESRRRGPARSSRRKAAAIAVTAMTAGSVLLMWIGELITEQGIGNGISLVIFAGIISQLPKTFGTILSSLFDTTQGKLSVFGWFELPVNPTAFGVVVGISVLGLAILYVLVKINEAQRIITINYAKRVGGNTSYGGIKSILPVKLIAAGVIPVIFAVAFLSLPAFVGQVMKASPSADQTVAANLVKWFQAPTTTSFASGDWGVAVYPIAYFLLVIAFTYFYTAITLNPTQMAEDMKRNNGFIPGVKPGKDTAEYIDTVMSRITLPGSLFIAFIAIMPALAGLLDVQQCVNNNTYQNQQRCTSEEL